MSPHDDTPTAPASTDTSPEPPTSDENHSSRPEPDSPKRQAPERQAPSAEARDAQEVEPSTDLAKIQPGDAPERSGPLSSLQLFGVAALLVVVSLGIGFLLGGGSAGPPATPERTADAPSAPKVWTCSMHPAIKLPAFGACPICGMDLIPLVHGAGGQGEPRVLTLSPQAAALAEVETVPVQRRSVSREVRLVGKIDFDETRLTYITAWISGRLDRLFVDSTGTLVREGDHLVEIYSPELLSAQEELVQALSSRDKIQDSSSDLLKATSEQTLRSAREKLRLWGLSPEQIAEVERAGKSSDHMTIHATTSGVVVHKNKKRGEYVKTGEAIYAIADLSRVWVKLDAYESDLGLVRYGQSVSFETVAYPGESFQGQVVFIDPVVTEHTRTVKVRLNVDNAEGRLKPGMFVRATLRAPVESDGEALAPAVRGKWICPMHREEIHDESGACSVCGMPLVEAESLFASRETQGGLPLVVPASAVLWTGVRSVVYVQRPESHAYEGREVVLGPRAGDWYVVHTGLAEGDLVVTKGAFKIDSALQIEARPSMMLPSESLAPELKRAEAPAAFLEALDPIFARYLEVQSALARDELAPAQAALVQLLRSLQDVQIDAAHEEAHRAWLALAKRLRDAASVGQGAPSLGEVRVAFQPLSQAILELERTFGHSQGDLAEAYCSMAFDDTGAAWLQSGEELNNPYFGASMLRCGEVRASFPPRAKAPAPAGPEQQAPSPAPRPDPALSPGPTSAPASQPASQPAFQPGLWTCSMHAEVKEARPGKCPTCGMKLVPTPSADPISETGGK